jgi:hypothetical protein
MPSITLHFENNGPLIVASNYWESELAAAGLLYLSANAGCFRLLVPQPQSTIISDMRPGAKHVVVSMLSKEKWVEKKKCIEWMVDDGSNTPWSCELSTAQVDCAGTPDDVGKKWIGTVWDLKNGQPHKCLERPAYFQIVPELPWLRKISN